MYPAPRSHADRDVLAHMSLVRGIAYHLHGRLPDSVQVDDLIQAGAIGLMDAMRDYEDGHGASFETYAGIRIRGAMLDEIRRQDWAPRSAHRDGRRISDAIRAVEARTGRAAAGRDIAAELGVDMSAYQALVQKVAQARMLSLDEPVGADGGSLEPADEAGDGPGGAWERAGFAAALAEAVAGLPERERLMMSLYYDEELNLKEVGAVLGVTESRVSQIHGQALARLRARLAPWYGQDAP